MRAEADWTPAESIDEEDKSSKQVGYRHLARHGVTRASAKTCRHKSQHTPQRMLDRVTADFRNTGELISDDAVGLSTCSFPCGIISAVIIRTRTKYSGSCESPRRPPEGRLLSASHGSHTFVQDNTRKITQHACWRTSSMRHLQGDRKTFHLPRIRKLGSSIKQDRSWKYVDSNRMRSPTRLSIVHVGVPDHGQTSFSRYSLKVASRNRKSKDHCISKRAREAAEQHARTEEHWKSICAKLMLSSCRNREEKWLRLERRRRTWKQ